MGTQPCKPSPRLFKDCLVLLLIVLSLISLFIFTRINPFSQPLNLSCFSHEINCVTFSLLAFESTLYPPFYLYLDPIWTRRAIWSGEPQLTHIVCILESLQSIPRQTRVSFSTPPPTHPNQMCCVLLLIGRVSCLFWGNWKKPMLRSLWSRDWVFIQMICVDSSVWPS